VFGKMGQECDDVVFGHGLDFINARDVEFDILGFPDGICVFARDYTQIGHGITGVGLDFIPDFEFRLWGPDGNHIGAGITRDHKINLIL